MKITRILGAVMALTLSAAPVFGFANAVTKKMITVQITAEAAKSGKWMQSGDKWWYRHDDGSYTKGDWELIGGKWYYFDYQGWMKTGKIEVNKKYYILGSDGAMLTGWVKTIEAWHYCQPGSGECLTEWRYINGSMYYFNAFGQMRAGLSQIRGKWYYLEDRVPECDKDYGKMRTGLIRLNGKTYYADSNGVIKR